MNTARPDYDALCLYIDGEFLGAENRQTQPVINPATLETLGELPLASDDDLARAIAAASRALRSWKNTSPLERGTILRRAGELARERVDSIARQITLDQGKPLAEARIEVLGCADHCDWHAEEARRIYGRVIPPRSPEVKQLVLREPIGVCCAFTAWNFPYNQAIRKVGAALAAGCTIILKGPEDCPSGVLAMARTFHDAGLPAGCLNIVWGEPAHVSETLIASPAVRKISFTGSVPVGKQLAAQAGAHMKRVTMELGGHAPVLVFADADIPRAAQLLCRYKTRNAGQVCISPSRFYIQQTVYEQFIDCFTAELSKIRLGDGLDPDVTMGPLTNERRLAAMHAFLDDARAHGAQIHACAPLPNLPGYFHAPTLLTEIPAQARIMTEEPFGPLVPLTPFHNLDEALALANALPYGLCSYVFTENLKIAHICAHAIEAGMVNINHSGVALPETPFGGIKDSGIGSEGGAESLDAYLTTKFVTQM